jgi:ribosomal protein L16/L10AE
MEKAGFHQAVCLAEHGCERKTEARCQFGRGVLTVWVKIEPGQQISLMARPEERQKVRRSTTHKRNLTCVYA